MRFWTINALNALSLSMLLMLLSSGFSLIFGTMRVINLAHGAYYLVGAYVALTTVRITGNFLLGVLTGTAVICLIALVMLRGFLVRVMGRPLDQVLMTIGFALVLGDLALWVWGGQHQTVPRPSFASGSVSLGSIIYPTYRLFVIVMGLLVAIGTWLLYERTRLGALVRATVDDAEMAGGVGINVNRVVTTVFVTGAGLAAIGGAIGAPFLGLRPGLDFEVLSLALVVVILGGLGSLPGAFVGSLVVGVADTLGRVYFPELALFTVFAPAALILAVRPTGLFGREEGL